MSDSIFLEDSYELVDIHSIESLEDDRIVYDLEVEEDHTYLLANRIISHNSRAKAGKSMLKELTKFCGKYRIPFIFTNHSYKDVASAPNPMYAKEIQSGGNQATYMASSVIMMRKKVDKDETTKKKVGSILRCRSDKNRLCRDEQTVEMYLSFATGPNKYYGLLEDAVSAGVLIEVNKKNYIIADTEEKVKVSKLYNGRVFTKERLEKINEYCNKQYKYAKVDLEFDDMDLAETE